MIYRPCCWQFHVGERIHSSSTHHGWEADFRVNCPFNRHHFCLILVDFFSVNFSSRPSTTVLVKPKATQSQNSHIITLASWHGKLYKEWTHPADTRSNMSIDLMLRFRPTDLHRFCSWRLSSCLMPRYVSQVVTERVNITWCSGLYCWKQLHSWSEWNATARVYWNNKILGLKN